jgi:hypothetical protein
MRAWGVTAAVAGSWFIWPAIPADGKDWIKENVGFKKPSTN